MTDFLHNLKAFYTSLFKLNQGRINDIMIGRCFGHLSKPLNLKEADAILKKAELKEYHINKRDFKSFRIQAVEKGRLKGLVEREFITCLIKVELTVNKYIPTIDVERDEIVSKSEEVAIKLSIPAWIFKDEIIFSKAELARDVAVPYLSEILQVKIAIPHYDIKRIYNDYKQEAGKIFGFGFMDRPNSIKSGTIFGEMESDDPLVAELDGEDKSFVAINLKIKESLVRASIYSIGSIVIMQKWLKMAESYPKLRIIRDMLKQYEV
jgi:hypothetical protein